MANTATNVTAAKPAVAGAVWVAPIGTTLPTDATTALGSTFTSLGFISADGLTNNVSSDTTEIREWGGTTVEVLEDNFSDEFSCTLIEGINPDVLKLVHGNATGSLSAGLSVIAGAADRTEQIFVVDMILRGGVVKRIVIPRGHITEVGEITYRRNQAVGYKITIAALYDTAIAGTHKEMLKSPTTGSSDG